MLFCVQERSAARPQYPERVWWFRQLPPTPAVPAMRASPRRRQPCRSSRASDRSRSAAAVREDRRSLTGPTPPLARPAWTVQPEGAIVTPQGLTRCCATMSAPGGKVRGTGLDEDRGQRAGLSGRQASGSRHEARNQRDAGHPFLGKLLAGSRRHAAGGRLEAGPPIVAAAVAGAQERASRTGRGPVTAAGGTGTFTLPERSAGAWSATIRGRGKAHRPVSLPGEAGTAAEPVRQGRRQGDPCPPGAPPAARRRGPECDSGSTGRDTKRGDGGRATRPITRFMNMHHGGHQPPSPRPYLSCLSPNRA